MSSRTGPRAAGTDGSDFQHRETIKQQYIHSARVKMRMKTVLFLHFFLACALLLKLAPAVMQLLHIDDSLVAPVPKSDIWEWVWLTSCFITSIAYTAVRKSNVRFMTAFACLLVPLALAPIVGGVVHHASSIYALTERLNAEEQSYWRSVTSVHFWRSCDHSELAATIWFAFGSIALQIHLAELYYAVTLIKAWRIPLKKML